MMSSLLTSSMSLTPWWVSLLSRTNGKLSLLTRTVLVTPLQPFPRSETTSYGCSCWKNVSQQELPVVCVCVLTVTAYPAIIRRNHDDFFYSSYHLMSTFGLLLLFVIVFLALHAEYVSQAWGWQSCVVNPFRACLPTAGWRLGTWRECTHRKNPGVEPINDLVALQCTNSASHCTSLSSKMIIRNKI